MNINANERVGLAVMRLQPFHLGHCRIINNMIQQCETAIVCIGSAQEKRTKHNPYTVEERITMLRNVYGDRIKFIPLTDIGAANPKQWVNYICDKIIKLGLTAPTDYYTGSEADAQWYKDHFYNERFHDDEMFEMFINDGDDMMRVLHIVERNNNVYHPATDIRSELETRTDGWLEWVPEVNHDIVNDNYPEELKIPLD